MCVQVYVFVCPSSFDLMFKKQPLVQSLSLKHPSKPIQTSPPLHSIPHEKEKSTQKKVEVRR